MKWLITAGFSFALFVSGCTLSMYASHASLQYAARAEGGGTETFTSHLYWFEEGGDFFAVFSGSRHENGASSLTCGRVDGVEFAYDGEEERPVLYAHRLGTDERVLRRNDQAELEPVDPPEPVAGGETCGALFLEREGVTMGAFNFNEVVAGDVLVAEIYCEGTSPLAGARYPVPGRYRYSAVTATEVDDATQRPACMLPPHAIGRGHPRIVGSGSAAHTGAKDL